MLTYYIPANKNYATALQITGASSLVAYGDFNPANQKL
jgi:hypothetical protein